MRERMEQIGGRLRVESAPGRGTRIVAVAPARRRRGVLRGPEERR
jgi:signal transduction histidine kinase